MFPPRLAPALLLVWGAAPLAACDLDGLPGFHRANPFARAPIFRGAPPVQPATPAPGGEPVAKPKELSPPDYAPAPRPWERTDNPGPISPEDKAIFT